MDQTAHETERDSFSLHDTLSHLLFPRLNRSRAAVRADAPAYPAHVESEDESVETQDAELIVAVFRTVILLIVIFAPRLLGLSHESQAREFWLAALAGLYNIGALIACLLPHRLGLRRPFIVVMDVMLITTWIRLSGQWDLFPFYYVVVVVAAMWFRVIGGMLTALACSVLYLLIWHRFALAPDGTVQVMPMRVTLEMALLMLVGCVAGYIGKAQDVERRRRLAHQLLLGQYQREIDISAQMQPLLMPPALTSEGQSTLSQSAPATLPSSLEVGAAMQPARPGYGGDYFDILPLSEGRIALCIADVSGKSVRAQARLPLLKYALRALAPLYTEPAELMAQLNQTLQPDLQPNFYIALCYMVVDPRHETLTWCNAGHMAPLLLARTDETASTKKRPPLSPLAAPGPPLGVFEEAKYASHTLPWRPGDQLLLYTDGLTDMLSETDDGEARDGEVRLRELALEAARHTERGAQEIAREFVSLTEMSTLSSDASTRDDVTVVFVRHRLEGDTAS